MKAKVKRAHGHILSVETLTRGSALAADAAAGATSITVIDAGDFDEDGGWLTIGGQVIEFTGCDDDAGTIALADPLSSTAEEGDTVAVWSELYEETIEYQEALVQLEGDRDNPEGVTAEVAEGVGYLPEGDRGRAGESCTLHRVGEDEWEVVGVGGRGRQSQGIRWEQDDTYTLTAADITAGTATMPLSHRPRDEALTCVLAGVPQRPANWTINYDAQTLTQTLSGWEQAGMVLWVHYAYRKGVKTATVLRDPVVPSFVSYTSRVSPGSGLAWPTGTQDGDLLILGCMGGQDSAVGVSDVRLTLVGETVQNGRTLQVWAGYASDLATEIGVTVAETSSSVAYMHMAVAAIWRGVGGEQLLWKPGSEAEITPPIGDTTSMIPGLPDSDLSGAVMVYMAESSPGGVYGDQTWSKAPEYELKVDREDTYIEIDMALTTQVPVPSVLTPNNDSAYSVWAAFVIGVQ